MCGILGMVSTTNKGFNWSEVKVFEQLLWAGTLRGDDSTGVFGVNKYGNVDYLKTAGNTADMIKTKEYEEFNRNIFSDFSMVVGHNRKATRGAVSDDNAHPFVENNHILVHNGTLTSWDKLTEKKVDVDSHAILHSIVERGYKDTIKDIQGAFTLVWYDATTKELHLIRNEQRPLFIANVVGAWYFASEKGMLQWILGREGCTVQDYTDAKPGMLYTFKLDDKTKSMYKEQLELYTPYVEVNNKVVTALPNKSKTTITKKKTKYEQTIFHNTRILFIAENTHKAAKPLGENLTHLITGYWYSNKEIKVTVWATEADIQLVQESEEEGAQWTANVRGTSSKNDKITLLCDQLLEYNAIYDKDNNELLNDDFIMTNKECSYCNKPVTFNELEGGTMSFDHEDDYLICCPDCYNKYENIIL